MASVWYNAITANIDDLPAPVIDAQHDDAADTSTALSDCTKVPGTAVGPVQIQHGSGLTDGVFAPSYSNRGVLTMPDGIARDDSDLPDGVFFAQLITSTQFRETALDELVFVTSDLLGWRYQRLVNDPANAGSYLAPEYFDPGVQCPPDSKFQYLFHPAMQLLMLVSRNTLGRLCTCFSGTMIL